MEENIKVVSTLSLAIFVRVGDKVTRLGNFSNLATIGSSESSPKMGTFGFQFT